MYVIYPADELILMTYGFFAPRVKPRPTLDCLREPLVPIEYPPPRANSSNLNSNNNNRNNCNNNYSNNSNYFSAAPAQPIPAPASSSPHLLAAPTPPTSPQANIVFGFSQQEPTALQSPLPVRRTSRASLTHSNSSNPFSSPGGSKRSSVRSNRSRPLTPLLPHQRALSTPTPTATPMYHDGSGNSPSSAPPAPGRAPFQRSGAYDDTTDEPDRSLTEYAAGGGGGLGSSLALAPRSRSPSIFLEPPTPDPTHAHFGPGWGRPMSPMDLPPERPSSSSGIGGGRKSPTSKSRLRPKLHIPLGRLGRSSSSDTRESNRLREDVHVHVENPVFSSENLRQNNFDAFFEAREPVIKLHPRTPNTAPAADGRSYSPPLDRYAGVYDSPRARSPAGSGAGGGGLFARSPREERERALQARSRSADEAGGGAARGAAGGAASAGAGAGGGGGTPSKGDRCLQKLLSHKLIEFLQLIAKKADCAASCAAAALPLQAAQSLRMFIDGLMACCLID